jgi:HEPN domain-containing protein
MTVNGSNDHVVDRAVVSENESAARRAYERADYVLCFLLSHALVEALLRAFLSRTGREQFDDLITAYGAYLTRQGQSEPDFVEELTQFNRRRNRVIHNLWKYGFSATNRTLEPACRAAFMMLGLFIEWLETFDPEITEAGFHYD